MATKKYKAQQAKLVSAAKALAKLKRAELTAKKKNQADLQRNDFLWHYLLQSFSTMGGAFGYKGLIETKRNYDDVTYSALGKVIPGRRATHAYKVLKRAKVRYAKRKGKYIAACYDKIKSLGGPKRAKGKLLGLKGRDAKIAFLKTFPGIGEKYARNLMMDVYHKDFRDCIAIDSRIQNITEEWGIEFGPYEDYESFYLGVATDAGLSGWELDRLMFGYPSVFYPPITKA